MKLKLKLPPRPALPNANAEGAEGIMGGLPAPSNSAPTAQPDVPSQQQHAAIASVAVDAGPAWGMAPETTVSGVKRKAEDDAGDQGPSKRSNNNGLAQPAAANGAAWAAAAVPAPMPMPSAAAPTPSSSTAPVIRKITIKHPVGQATSAAPMQPSMGAGMQPGLPAALPAVPAALDKVQLKQMKEQQKQVAKEEKQRAKVEAAQEKQRQKLEAEQEKKRAQEQANFLKTIKLKIVQGSGSVLVGGGGGSGGSQPRATASSKPAAPAAAKPMAPSSMFLSATKSPGAVLKPKIKVSLPLRSAASAGAASGSGTEQAAAGAGVASSKAAIAPSRLKPGVGARAGGGAGRPAGAPAGPMGGAAGSAGSVSRQALDKILLKIQAKDARKIFLKPVTEDLAPNYFSIIKNPMDFTTIRQRIASGAYQGWDDMLADLDLTFTNCMTYNPAGTIYHLEAKKMQEIARRLVELGRKGETNFRGRTANIVKAHNAHIHAALQANASKPLGRGMRHGATGAEAGGAGSGGNAAGGGGGGGGSGAAPRVPGAIRAAQVAAGVQHPTGPRNAGASRDYHVLQHGFNAPPRGTRAPRGARAGALGSAIVRRPNNFNAHLHLQADAGPEGDARQTYHLRAVPPAVPFAHWTSLSNGATPDGLPLANGRPLLVTAMPPRAMNPDAYIASVARFTSRCSAAVRRAALSRLHSCVAVEGAVLPPEPDPPPEPPAPVPAPAPAPGVAGHHLGAAGRGAPAARPPMFPMAGGRGPGPGLGPGMRPGPGRGPGPLGSAPQLNLGAAAQQGNLDLLKALSLLQSQLNPQAQALAQLLAAGKAPGAPGAAAAAPNPLMLLLQQFGKPGAPANPAAAAAAVAAAAAAAAAGAPGAAAAARPALQPQALAGQPGAGMGPAGATALQQLQAFSALPAMLAQQQQQQQQQAGAPR